MKLIPINLPTGLTERSTIISGAIRPQDENAGFENYGVIFTTSAEPSPDDFDTNELLGAIVENTELPPEETDRFFTVIGGYYFERVRENGKKEAKTTRVFGIALDDSKGFFISEGGNTIIRDHWQLLEEKFKVNATNERTAGEKTGWTLIVAEAKVPRNMYPLSGKPMKIVVECSEITAMELVSREISESGVTVEAKVNTDGPAPETFIWDPGDGSSETETKEPSFSYTYQRPAGENAVFSLSVRTKGPGGCESEETIEIEVDGSCPVLEGIDVQEGELMDSELAITFIANASGGTPEKYSWDFGDGNQTETRENTVSHAYERPAGDPAAFEVKVVATGPGECSADAQTKISIPGVCPTLDKIEVGVGEMTDREAAFTFLAVTTGPMPRSFKWNFGDGVELITNEPSTTHSYQRPAGDQQEFEITVETSGPDKCSGSGTTKVSVPGSCPVFEKVEVEPGIPGETEHVYTFTAISSGPSPEKYLWDFGDGSEPVESAEPNVSHAYQRPAGVSAEFEVKVELTGPGECRSGGSVKITLSGVCPVAEKLNAQLGALSESELTIAFTVVTSGPSPERYVWDFGDGTGDTTTENHISHNYSRKEVGGKELAVTVDVLGPGQCAGEVQTRISIPSPCPEITGIEAISAEPEVNSLEISFSAIVHGNKPDIFRWRFGDGTTAETRTAEVSHKYLRPAGNEVDFTVSVSTAGPGECRGEGRTTVKVPGTCPAILEIDCEPGELTPSQQVVNVSANVEGGNPEKYIWNFGDGSEEVETTIPQVSHTYERPDGDAETYTISLKIHGPGECSDAATVDCPVPGECPVVTTIIKGEGASSERELFAIFTAAVSGPAPDRFIWNFGDGTEDVVSKESMVRHTFQRPVGDAKVYTVTVKTQGPESCRSGNNTRIQVPGVCPEIVGLDAAMAEVSETGQSVIFTAQLRAHEHGKYIWDFGDGTEKLETTESRVSHIYAPKAGKSANYIASVEGSGPGRCNSRAETQVNISGECPVLGEVHSEISGGEKGTISMVFTAGFSGPRPDAFEWKFNDGFHVESSEPRLERNFERYPEEDQTLTGTLTAAGPENCRSDSSFEVFIPRLCPAILDISYTSEETGVQELKYNFRVKLEDGEPETYTWDFGDGSKPVVTESPEVSHVYRQPGGNPESRKVSVTTRGPGNCRGGTDITLELPGSCPALRELICEPGTLSKETLEVRFRAFIVGPGYDNLIWDFGDGTPPVTSKNGIQTHTYQRPAGKKPERYRITVKINGPAQCFSEGEVECEVPGVCPFLRGVNTSVVKESIDSYEIAFRVEYDAPDPEKFIWDFGDGSEKVETTIPEVKHGFRRPAAYPSLHPVIVQAIGPEDCFGQLEKIVEIPGTCPEIQTLEAKPEPVAEKELTVHYSVTTIGPVPEKYTWDISDGSDRIVTDVPSLTHVFTRPAGKDRDYSVKLTITGPEKCIDGKTVVTTVPGRCPKILALRATTGDLQKTELSVEFEAELDDLTSDNYIWDFGDGTSPLTTKKSKIAHTYQRPVGKNGNYTVKLTGSGPDHCKAEITTQVEVPYLCPEITRVSHNAKSPTDKELEVTFTAHLEPAIPLPESFEWNFGDGSDKKTTKVPTVTHRYARPSGDSESYEVTVSATGPGTCGSSGKTTCPVPGICPVINDVQVNTELRRDQLIVTLVPKIAGPVPDGYKVEWGDGVFRPEMLVQPPFTNTYPRPIGEDQVIQLKIISFGPDSCQTNWDGEISIPGQCPIITNVRQQVTHQDLYTQTIEFEVDIEGPQPLSYIWNWGGGKHAQITKEPRVSHTFDRIGGEDQEITVTASLKGPGKCDYSEEVQVKIPGSCPRLTNIRKEIVEAKPESQVWKFTVIHEGPDPVSFSFDWGDKSGVATITTNEFTHEYKRLPGNDRSYYITVTSWGPKKCKSVINTEVEIPGICPKFKKVDTDYLEITPASQRVKATAVVDGPVPDVFVWNWGDGSEHEETTTSTAFHNYERKPGDDKIYSVIVTARGPESCQAGAAGDVEIPGLCPEIRKFSAELLPIEPEYQEVKVTLEFAGPAAKSYIWDWGDDSTPSTTVTPEATHRYRRLPGDPVVYTVQTMLAGPESCQCEDSLEVTVRGICPEIREVRTSIDPPGKENQKVHAVAITEGPPPEKYLWNWGDGSEIEPTTEPEAWHEYARPNGDDVPFKIKVETAGPGCCESSDDAEVVISGICPEIQRAGVVEVSMTKTTQTMRMVLIVDGPDPDSFVWDWGDGCKPETTRVREATHTYQRPEGDDKVFNATVTAYGPGKKCLVPFERGVSIKGICPEITNVAVETLRNEREFQEIRIVLSIDGPEPTSVEFDWGDNTEPMVLKGRAATHIYHRLPGEDKKYIIQAKINGPGSCGHRGKGEILIPGICPYVEELKVETVHDGIMKKRVKATALIDGPAPNFYEWNWGDGSKPEKTDVPYAEHDYERPIGADRYQAMEVRGFGPGKCRCGGEVEFTIEGVCPSLVSLSADLQPPDGPKQEVILYANLGEGPLPESYEWDLGDGRMAESAEPSIRHRYTRGFGVDKVFHPRVKAVGPTNYCEAEKGCEVTISGWCSSHAEITSRRLEVGREVQTLEFSVSVDGPTPSAYIWDWGDGTPLVEKKEPTVVHAFRRPVGDDIVLTPKVTIKGPGPCEIGADTWVKVEGVCPRITGIDYQLLPSEAEGIQKVRVEIEVDGPLEDPVSGEKVVYKWDWDNGETSKSDEPWAEFSYERAYGEDTVYSVAVAMDGPVSCDCNAITQVHIPGRCPKLIFRAVEYHPWDDDYQGVKISFEVEGKPPKSYTWHWGNGETTQTKEAWAVYEFRRPMHDTDYMVRVVGDGPGYCAEEQCVMIQVDGYCPKITKIQTSYCGDNSNGQQIKVMVLTRGRKPARYGYDFGDGKGMKFSEEHTMVYTYPFSEGRGKDYTITVHVYGALTPEDEEHCKKHDIPACESSDSTVVHIAGKCPAIVQLRPVLGKADQTSQWVKFVAITRGPAPISFSWEWGDGSSKEQTTAPFAEHLFRKPASGSKTYVVRVIAHGPENKKGGKSCEDQFEAFVTLEADKVMIDC